MRVLAFDLGKNLGFGLLGPGIARSGSLEILKAWAPFGPALLILEKRMQALVDQHKPDVLCAARPFVRRGRKGAMVDTPNNLVPMFGAFAILHRLAAVNRLPLEIIQESAARSALVGKNMMMAKSEAVKRDVIRACRDRGWPCCNDHAADSLCIAAATLERLQPGQAHQTTPLFLAAVAPPKRRRRAA